MCIIIPKAHDKIVIIINALIAPIKASILSYLIAMIAAMKKVYDERHIFR